MNIPIILIGENSVHCRVRFITCFVKIGCPASGPRLIKIRPQNLPDFFDSEVLFPLYIALCPLQPCNLFFQLCRLMGEDTVYFCSVSE